jgi:glycosyltransferase involved in cell wall biosynthesis
LTPAEAAATGRPRLVCLTPVKNEEWILDRFLRAASTWADLIVVADQRSSDRSPEIVSSHAKAVLVENESEAYNEVERQRLLLEAARRLVPGPRILIALDADEALNADAPEQPEWQAMLGAPPGTVLRMQWVNLLPEAPRAWIPPRPKPFGFVDNGAPHHGDRIHTPRLPTPAGAPVLDLDRIKVLHLQHLDD